MSVEHHRAQFGEQARVDLVDFRRRVLVPQAGSRSSAPRLVSKRWATTQEQSEKRHGIRMRAGQLIGCCGNNFIEPPGVTGSLRSWAKGEWVWFIQDATLAREVALKVLRPELGTHPDRGVGR